MIWTLVKHLQRFPNEGLGQVVRNVFDFDAYDQEARKSVEEVLQKHGMWTYLVENIRIFLPIKIRLLY